jgi:hypothetical protein
MAKSRGISSQTLIDCPYHRPVYPGSFYYLAAMKKDKRNMSVQIAKIIVGFFNETLIKI